MINLFYREYWNVAIRKKVENEFPDSDGEFHVIKNGKDYWLADPFLYEYEGENYIFAELYDCKKGKGVIAFHKCGESEMVWHIAIEEEYHLSYPLIYTIGGHIYMIPESSYGDNLCCYKATNFPYTWEKKVLLQDVRVVDTTIYPRESGGFSGITTIIDDKKYHAHIVEFDGCENFVISEKTVSEDLKYSRCGGNIYSYRNNKYLVLQDCGQYYGKQIHFVKITSNDLRTTFESIKPVFSLSIGDVKLDNACKYIGLHTYNTNDTYEVIDVKHMEFNLRHVIYSVIRRTKVWFEKEKQ
ncbi:hypothetical protein [Butyrivibrio fibrisolvens]|uniref:glucosamine inositolphosphorylceramide transferase family protein n=1 Tax=Butyrivibrio fibrisolvens TaxID=831 RepID=UPI0003B5C4F2|nr:hypothetical protein [Butyrivibrio fibrisolvens]